MSRTLWRVLREAAGSDIEPQLADLRPGELQRSCLDSSLAQRELGWRAEVPIEGVCARRMRPSWRNSKTQASAQRFARAHFGSNRRA